MNTTEASSIFDTGSIIDGKWVLIERIGKGGMGEVHRAHQLNLKRDVALKLISREFLLDLEDNPEEAETLRARFQREVSTTFPKSRKTLGATSYFTRSSSNRANRP